MCPNFWLPVFTHSLREDQLVYYLWTVWWRYHTHLGQDGIFWVSIVLSDRSHMRWMVLPSGWLGLPGSVACSVVVQWFTRHRASVINLFVANELHLTIKCSGKRNISFIRRSMTLTGPSLLAFGEALAGLCRATTAINHKCYNNQINQTWCSGAKYEASQGTGGTGP